MRKNFDPKRRWVIATACVAFCTVVVLRHYFSLALALGSSMSPTLRNGDLLLISRCHYSQTAPCRGDIVLARHKDELVVKRVVGLPGEEVEVKGAALYINDVLVPEVYTLTNSVQFDIAKGKLFSDRFATLGDNRSIPPTQAFHPIVSKEQIVGKVIFSISMLRFHFKYVG